ncbi:MAG: NUDIX hydrolase [Pseudomonadota bacterium]
MEEKIQTLATLKTHSFSVNLDEVRLKGGEIGKRVKIDHPEAAAIVPFVSEEEILMVRQFRYALGKETYEIPAGKFDPGETSEECVRRELLEETGYEAGEVHLICTYAPAISYSNELIHVFRGRDLKKTGSKTDDREIESVEIVSFSRLDQMIREGVILDGKTLLGLSMLKWHGVSHKFSLRS